MHNKTIQCTTQEYQFIQKRKCVPQESWKVGGGGGRAGRPMAMFYMMTYCLAATLLMLAPWILILGERIYFGQHKHRKHCLCRVCPWFVPFYCYRGKHFLSFSQFVLEMQQPKEALDLRNKF